VERRPSLQLPERLLAAKKAGRTPPFHSAWANPKQNVSNKNYPGHSKKTFKETGAFGAKGHVLSSPSDFHLTSLFKE